MPWDDDIDIIVMDIDLDAALEAAAKAGLGTQKVFFGGRIYPRPVILHGAVEGMAFIDVFAYKRDPASPHDLIFASIKTAELWNPKKYRITDVEWGAGIKRDVLTFQRPLEVPPPPDPKTVAKQWG